MILAIILPNYPHTQHALYQTPPSSHFYPAFHTNSDDSTFSCPKTVFSSPPNEPQNA